MREQSLNETQNQLEKQVLRPSFEHVFVLFTSLLSFPHGQGQGLCLGAPGATFREPVGVLSGKVMCSDR